MPSPARLHRPPPSRGFASPALAPAVLVEAALDPSASATAALAGRAQPPAREAPPPTTHRLSSSLKLMFDPPPPGARVGRDSALASLAALGAWGFSMLPPLPPPAPAGS